MTKQQIIHTSENAKAFVIKLNTGHFEVYENTSTHSTRKGTYHYSDNEQKALSMAIARCNSIAA